MNGRALHPETVIAQGPAGFAPQVEVARVGGGQLGLTPDGRWTFRLRPPGRLAPLGLSRPLSAAERRELTGRDPT